MLYLLQKNRNLNCQLIFTPNLKRKHPTETIFSLGIPFHALSDVYTRRGNPAETPLRHRTCKPLETASIGAERQWGHLSQSASARRVSRTKILRPRAEHDVKYYDHALSTHLHVTCSTERSSKILESSIFREPSRIPGGEIW